ncbi:MAG: isoleucine--tRNA ligase [Bdellovibrionales bacterium]|nr:isoleucine--tRNA ligase [Bdellovibrionales bacterium]
MKITKPKTELSFPTMEEELLQFWKKEKVFQRSVSEKSDDQTWSFYDGPPFATGLPHYGHLLAGTIKDVVPRYWTMRGKKIQRRFGWDCHGLPIEFETEKRLELKGRKDILAFGVDRFNEECRSIVLRYTQEWEKTVERMGRWIDFENDYKTMDVSFMESVWSVFKKLWDKGLIYEDKKVLPYSTRITTPLSNFEANLNYQDVQDPAVTVKLTLESDPTVSLLVWTTTPWTLPANHAAAVNPEITYVKVKPEGSHEFFIVAKNLVAQVFGKSKIETVQTFQGAELVGLKYKQMIPSFIGKMPEKTLQVYAADYVTEDSGTGIVHLAPYGEEDFEVFKRVGIDPLEHLDQEGIFTDECSIAQGLYFKDADKIIIDYLKQNKLLFKQETIQHSYPFCYRSDTPLIYKPVSTWFVAVTKIKEQLIKNNQQTHWVPEHLRDGRFGKWLENARDWAISRNRFWGNPLPIWRNADTGETICIGSVDELKKLSGKDVNDLHKHFVDQIEITSPKTGDTLTRIPEILDCWFESGSMPYAQNHYPFSVSEEDFGKKFPAEFIAEGLDQTRGWFYTLMVLSTALDKGPAFKNVVVNGIVLAEDGRKMSKRLQNYPDPIEVLNQYGADTLRIYLLQSGAVQGEDLRFSEEGLKEMTRKVLLPFYNAYSFFATYASVDGWDPQKDYTSERSHELDQWIEIKLAKLTQEICIEMDRFHLSKVIPPLLSFIDDLTNWYIRRSRRRFWKSENDTAKHQAYSTLFHVLVTFSKLAAPFIPFISEFIYQSLSSEHEFTQKDSVHLEVYPQAKALSQSESELEQAMDIIRRAVGLGRELREKLKIKNRQPLSTMYIGVVHQEDEKALQSMKHIVQEELNVHDVVFLPSEKIGSWVVKPNFKSVGKKVGSKMKEFQSLVANLTKEQVEGIINDQEITLMDQAFGADDFTVELKAITSFSYPCHSAGSLVVALDDQITEDLQNEGLTRELINRVQRFRKDCELEVENHIHLHVQTQDDLRQAFEKYQGLIESETLSHLRFEKPASSMKIVQEKLDQFDVTIGISRVE